MDIFALRSRAYKDSPGQPSSRIGISPKISKGPHRFNVPVAQIFKSQCCSFSILALNCLQMSIKSSKMSDRFQPFRWIRCARLEPQLEGVALSPHRDLIGPQEEYSVQDKFNRLPSLSTKFLCDTNSMVSCRLAHFGKQMTLHQPRSTHAEGCTDEPVNLTPCQTCLSEDCQLGIDWPISSLSALGP
jgi:hypothetical protein